MDIGDYTSQWSFYNTSELQHEYSTIGWLVSVMSVLIPGILHHKDHIMQIFFNYGQRSWMIRMRRTDNGAA